MIQFVTTSIPRKLKVICAQRSLNLIPMVGWLRNLGVYISRVLGRSQQCLPMFKFDVKFMFVYFCSRTDSVKRLSITPAGTFLIRPKNSNGPVDSVASPDVSTTHTHTLDIM